MQKLITFVCFNCFDIKHRNNYCIKKIYKKYSKKLYFFAHKLFYQDESINF